MDRIIRRTPLAVVSLIAAAAATWCASAQAVTATGSPLIGGIATHPTALATGPDGNVWYSFAAPNAIARVTPQNVSTVFRTDVHHPLGIAGGPDDAVWFSSDGTNQIGRITPDGTVTLFPGDTTTLDQPKGIALGGDGNLWFIDAGDDKLGRITPAGAITEFPGPPGFVSPASGDAITAGPDGNVWFTDSGNNEIGRITPSGVVTEFPGNTTTLQHPMRITAGPDGNVWFTDFADDRIGRVTPAGAITEFASPLPSNGSADGPSTIATGADGNIWFGDGDDTELGRMTPCGSAVAATLDNVMGAYRAPFDMVRGPDGDLWWASSTNFFVGGQLSDLTDVGAVSPPCPSGGSEGGGGPSPGPNPPPTAAVAVRSLSLSPTTFRAVTGTMVTFVLSAFADVRFTVTAYRSGRRSGTRCAAPTRADRHGHSCTRTVTLPGHVTRSAPAGTTTWHFNGRLDGRALKAGHYRLVATPAGRGAKARGAAFVVRR